MATKEKKPIAAHAGSLIEETRCFFELLWWYDQVVLAINVADGVKIK